MRSPKRPALVGIVIATAALGVATAAPAKQSDISKVRKATAKYHRLSKAKKDGYGLLRDAAGIACIDKPGEGGMGIHYVNGDLVGDGAINKLKPELFVYQPLANGGRKLVANEYVVMQSDWDAEHSSPPKLFGQEFELIPEGNRYGLPPFYELHAWLWKHNSSGMFADWNPKVSC